MDPDPEDPDLDLDLDLDLARKADQACTTWVGFYKSSGRCGWIGWDDGELVRRAGVFARECAGLEGGQTEAVSELDLDLDLDLDPTELDLDPMDLGAGATVGRGQGGKRDRGRARKAGQAC